MNSDWTFGGYWKFENGLAVYNIYRSGEKHAYNYDSICDALQNVKQRRDQYVTQDAFNAHIEHLERGRSLFPVKHSAAYLTHE